MVTRIHPDKDLAEFGLTGLYYWSWFKEKKNVGPDKIFMIESNCSSCVVLALKKLPSAIHIASPILKSALSVCVFVYM